MQFQDQPITDYEELNAIYADIESRCVKIDNFQETGLTHQAMIEKLLVVLRSIQVLGMFSPNQKIREIPTQNLKFLVLPYHIGYLYGKISKPRKESILQSKSYLTTYLQICRNYNQEEEDFFPKSVQNMWKKLSQEPSYKPSRDQLVATAKETKAIQTRYKNANSIKQQSDRRKSILDYLTLKIFDSFQQLRHIEEELPLIAYKESLEKDQNAFEQYQQQANKPLPKMKIWQIRKAQEIQETMCPIPLPGANKQELVAKVWQQNANKPTISLEEVAQMQQENMEKRVEREKKLAEENKEDTDSDKQEVDDRQKKKARNWDDWKDDHEKGAGNRNGR